MNEKQARALGRFLREHRLGLRLSTRALAALCGVDMATIVRLEQGAFSEPRLDTLRSVAEALGISVADVFALADYAVPSELPAFKPYLLAKYRTLPPKAINELERYFDGLAAKYGIDPAGPVPGEDEAPSATRRKRR